MNIDKKKKIGIILGIIILFVLILGGTYAYVINSLNVTNGNYSETTQCFYINYSILNSDSNADDNQITGTLFPSKGALGGLSGRITVNVDETCQVTGVGNLYLYIDSTTSETLLKTVSEHCEDAVTLETLDEYSSSSSCVADSSRVWVSRGTGIKYAIYDNSEATGRPLNAGYITSSDIGRDIAIYADFTVDNTVRNYYIFIWMDGYITDDSYVSLPFSGHVHASVIQNS